MEREQLHLLIKEGEGLSVEFKEHFSSKIDKDMVAFANTSGGHIFLGVDDQGDVVNENLSNDLKAKINSLARNCEPAILLENIQQIDNVVVITVGESGDKPHSCSAGYFRRLDAATQKMNQKELRFLFKKSEHSISFERLICENVTHEDISFKKVNAFLSEAKAHLEQVKLDAVLSSLNLSKGNCITNAGALLFAKKPRAHIFHCEMILAAFKGTDKVHIYDRVDVQDDLITQFHQAMMFLRKHLNLRSEIRGTKRYDILEIPLEALREAVANAIIHRNYAMAGTSLMVEVYDDRVSIKNPGGLPEGMKLSELMQTSVRRNELIADIFSRINQAERMASGFPRIMRLLSEANLPKPMIESNAFFNITFKRDPKFKVGGIRSEESSEESSVKSSDKILAAIRKNPEVTASNLAEMLGISQRAVEKQLASLKRAGKIVRIGSTKAGHWEISS